MRWIRSLVRPRNSLIVVFDPKSPDEFDKFESKIEELGRYYSFAKLSALVGKNKAKPEMGLACVVIENPRVAFFQSYTPWLLEKNIPFTLFLRADCIGMNRLPHEEEWAIYRRVHPDKISESEMVEAVSNAWENPSSIESRLSELRAKYGPFPLNSLEPMQFFSTWGKVTELPSGLVDYGVRLTESPSDRARLSETVKFVSSRVHSELTVALSPRPVSSVTSLQSVGIHGLVGPNAGIVEPHTSVWELPRYEFRG